jgi:hypothetical protein
MLVNNGTVVTSQTGHQRQRTTSDINGEQSCRGSQHSYLVDHALPKRHQLATKFCFIELSSSQYYHEAGACGSVHCAASRKVVSLRPDEVNEFPQFV